MTQRVVIDASGYQGQIDFAAVKRAHPEVCAAILKATEGMWKFTNPDFDQQVQSAKAAGLGVGAYCFEHPGFAGTADAQLFLDRIRPYQLELGVWLDCETSDGVAPALMLDRLLEDANAIARNYPMRTGFYTARWWWDPNTVGSVQAHMETWPLWVAGYTAALPALPTPWRTAILWQYTDHHPALPGGCDASLFLGSDAQWQWLMTGALTAGHHPVPTNVVAFDIQVAVHANHDGIWGPDTDRRCEAVRAARFPSTHTTDNVTYLQEVMAFDAAHTDGKWGPVTEHHWRSTIELIQRALSVAADGVWGDKTDQAYFAASPMR